MYCTNCGTQHDGKFCPNCGTPAKQQATSPEPAQTPIPTPVQPDFTPESNQPPTHKRITDQWWFWVLIAFTVAALLYMVVTPVNIGKKGAVPNTLVEDMTESAVDAAEDVAKADPSALESIGDADLEEPTATEAPAAAAVFNMDGSDVTVTEQVLFEQDGVKVTLQSINFDGWWGPELSLLLENDTAKAVTVQAMNMSVNGAMVDGFLSCDVAADKKANDELTLSETELKMADIDVITDLSFYFNVYDSDSWETLFNTDTITIQTSAAGSYVQSFDKSGTVVLDQNGVRITVQGLNSNESLWGVDVNVLVENNSGRSVYVQTDDVSVNGFMIYPYFSCAVTDGKVAYDMISFMQSDLDENNITEIDTVELIFHVFDYDNWDTILDSDPITLTFPM